MGQVSDYREHIRQMQRRRDAAIAAYRGKRDLLRTYERRGIWNDTVRKLAETVRQQRKHLTDRGIIDLV